MTIRENILRAIAHDSPDHVPYYREGGIQLLSYAGALPPDCGLDLWGVRWRKTEEDLLSYPVEHPINSIHELQAYPFPDPHRPGLFDRLRTDIDKETNLVVGCHYTALFERYQSLCGMQRALTWMLDEREQTARFFMKLAKWHVEIAQSYVEIGVDAGRISDDYGAQASLLMSPDLWRSVVKPALAQIVEFYKRNRRLIFIHSCGHIMPILQDLVELGIDVFNIQTATNDLRSIKRGYGKRITLMGGVDTQSVLTKGTPAGVREATIAAIEELGEGGGLILEPDQRIAIPQENLEALIQTAKAFGSYSSNVLLPTTN